MFLLTPVKKQQMIADTENYLTYLKALPATTPCKQCEYFFEGYCEAYQTRPPTTFYEEFCEKFEDDIPF